MFKTLSTEEFIRKAILVHGNKYDYSKVEFIDSQTKVCIICPEHGEFWQRPNGHLSGKQCSKCASNRATTTKEFIEKAEQKHQNKYDYSKVEYINNYTRVCIICPEHGEFWQIPWVHIRGSGCPICADNTSLSKEEFVKRASITHHDKYDYSRVNYLNAQEKICIICPEHGEFWQRPGKHINGDGCPKCKSSKGEEYIRSFLKEKGIIFEEQKKFNDCKNILLLSFDFYLPEYNLCIEYQGRQHYEPISHFGGEQGLINQKNRDIIKRDFCCQKQIRLIEISYTEDIKEKLSKIFD